MYAASTAVVCMEVLKLVTCLCVVLVQQNMSAESAIKAIKEEVVGQPMEVLKLCVPSVLYVIQNNLLYFALSHLDAATYLIGYQLKILTTALFSTVLLGKVLTSLQWISLLLLVVGVSLAQLHASNKSAEAANAEISDHPETALISNNSVAGFLAVFMAACTSGFSGIYFEKILKGSKTSLWMRNIQMGISSTILATISVYVSDSEAVGTNGFFFGYTNTVIAVILLQALGGLVVAIVVKYADNILKGFAASFSIITSCIISYFYLDFQPSIEFVLGAFIVIFSSYIYEKGLPSALAFLYKKAPWLLHKVSKSSDDVHSIDDVKPMAHLPRPAIHGDANNQRTNKKDDDLVATKL
jgi:solute carrier family 35 (UDP-sugar transporter), member A1/2/3